MSEGSCFNSENPAFFDPEAYIPIIRGADTAKTGDEFLPVTDTDLLDPLVRPDPERARAEIREKKFL